MSPLKLVAIGILVVAIDLNVGSLDLLFDPVGYAMVALGVHRLTSLHAGFRWARTAAVVGLLASIWTAVGRRTEIAEEPFPAGVDGMDGMGGMTSTSSELVEPVLPGLVESLAQAGIEIAICTALIAVATSPRVIGPARTLRWALPTVSVLGALLGLVGWLALLEGEPTSSMASPLAVVAIPLVLLAIGLAIWFIVVLFRASREPGLGQPAPPAMIPA